MTNQPELLPLPLPRNRHYLEYLADHLSGVLAIVDEETARKHSLLDYLRSCVDDIVPVDRDVVKELTFVPETGKPFVQEIFLHLPTRDPAAREIEQQLRNNTQENEALAQRASGSGDNIFVPPFLSEYVKLQYESLTLSARAWWRYRDLRFQVWSRLAELDSNHERQQAIDFRTPRLDFAAANAAADGLRDIAKPVFHWEDGPLGLKIDRRKNSVTWLKEAPVRLTDAQFWYFELFFDANGNQLSCKDVERAYDDGDNEYSARMTLQNAVNKAICSLGVKIRERKLQKIEESTAKGVRKRPKKKRKTKTR